LSWARIHCRVHALPQELGDGISLNRSSMGPDGDRCAGAPPRAVPLDELHSALTRGASGTVR
jgi:hypothetical protein